MPSTRCQSCGSTFQDSGRHSRHLGLKPACQKFYDTLASQRAQHIAVGDLVHPQLEGQQADEPSATHDIDPRVEDTVSGHLPGQGFNHQDDSAHIARELRRVIVEEVEDEEGGIASPAWVAETYATPVAEGLGNGLTHFEDLRAEQERHGLPAEAPFMDGEEWDLAKWLLGEATQTGIDSFLKLPITRNRTQPSFKNKDAFFKKIDALPVGPEWICDVITVKGDQMGPNGQPLTEELELWRRDPVECVRELLGNPAFKNYMAYAPVRMKRGGVRFYGEMNTAEWWWNTQGKLPAGACIAPLILASDKTNLTVLRGDQTAWPVYLTIGNIEKSVRRKPSAHAVLLLGYIPTSKLHCFSKKTRSDAIQRLFHTCMAMIMEPLIDAGTAGVEMMCADGLVRLVYPILAAYVADHPEQCLVTCCRENRCPRCIVPRKRRGDNRISRLRNHPQTVDILRKVGEGDSPPEFEKYGLRPTYEPFWANLPHADIFASITPDILHQLHKGVIKDHLLVWVEKIVGKSALDERFAAMSKAHGLRHFPRGISILSQWTGAEAKEIEKILLGILVGRVSSRVLKAIRALLDFVYYAQYEVHSDKTLSQMRQALNTFHRNKDALIELGIREHFNIPKLHSLIHYVDAIIQLGCLDGVNTENSERLHIDYAKKAYRASSRREYLSQMTTWLQRQEAVERRQAYLAWRAGLLEEELLADEQGHEARDSDGEDPVDGTQAHNNDEGRPDMIDSDETDGDRDDNEEREEDERDDDNDNDNDDVAVGVRSQPDGSTEDVKALRQLLNSNVARAYQLPLTPNARRASVETVVSSYGAVDFLVEVNEYLHDYHPALPLIAEHSTFQLYHSLHLLLPANIHVSNNKRICKLRATPAAPRKRDRKAVSARFDCGLFILDEESYQTHGGLTGLRPGQVRAIFRLPDWMNMPEPLLYVNWFRPFRTPDTISALPPTSHSTRIHRRNASVVSIRDLVRTCHLMPKFGSEDLGRTEWMEKDVLDEGSLTFLYNRYYDVHTFAALS
ncbi:hypothetical protein BN946_scf184935.g4 [Trametes cinnabarina]|uniref:C2H2-type domain-containing protein n=1 Tax=Pycnoporus cinnabarinus TaxID=5643 RepID=A0A060SSN8_PYCCI|nr:hypothetical protein BN946_scf184935.g4 [Trametes cinnabarina]